MTKNALGTVEFIVEKREPACLLGAQIHPPRQAIVELVELLAFLELADGLGHSVIDLQDPGWRGLLRHAPGRRADQLSGPVLGDESQVQSVCLEKHFAVIRVPARP
jgi:hypothetical protein